MKLLMKAMERRVAGGAASGVSRFRDSSKSMKRMIRRCAMACVALAVAATTWAGNGAHNWLVVYDPVDPHGAAIAQHYQQVRRIPDALLAPYSFPKSATNAPSLQMHISRGQMLDLINFVCATMAERNLSNQIDGVALAGMIPFRFDPYGATAAGLFVGPNIATTVDGPWRTITVRDIDPVTVHSKRFIRLKVSQAP